MEIPDGFRVEKNIVQNKVCKLQKALYGLRVSPEKRNERFSIEAEKLGLQRDINEPCLFTYGIMGIFVILILYVDDILLTGNNLGKFHKIIAYFSSVFEMKNLGEPKDYLGIQIVRDRNSMTMTLNQATYTEKVLERFDMKGVSRTMHPWLPDRLKIEI